MPFNSVGFILFLIGSAILYQLIPAARRAVALAGASVLFYAMWNPGFALLLLAATGWAWTMALAVGHASDERSRSRINRRAVAALAVNLVLIKFMPQVLRQPLAVVGISYYTFKLISYQLDVYWGRVAPVKSFAALLAYTAFFPQIASGPIQRAPDFMEQLFQPECLDRQRALEGLRRLLWGFFKKFVIADRLAVLTGNVFARPEDYSAPALWIAAYAFYFQLFADFSGITDIAIGAGRLFGIDGPENFNRPVIAKNIQDFWRRWHMSLTSWLGDYLFTPLRMGLRDWGTAGLAISIIVNMMAIATWHDIAGHFVAFGLFHAAWMTVSVLTLAQRDRWFKARPAWKALRAVTGPFLTFNLVVLSFVFFKASSLTNAFEFIRGMTTGPLALNNLKLGVGRGEILMLAAAVVFMECAHAFKDKKILNRFQDGSVRVAADYGLIALILGFGVFASREFIYFKF